MDAKKLTLSMIVKNEGNRYLKDVLQQHRNYIDEAVIIDDGSTDNTADVCRTMLDGIPLYFVQNPVSKFSNEVELRQQQWEETVKTQPDWILNLDADEMFETRFGYEVKNLINRDDVYIYSFRLYDFWDEDNYREDRYWCAHFFYRPFLVRYKKDFHYKWRETPQHCGRLPENVFELPSAISELRLKHLGWANQEDRLKKYQRYMQLDPDAKYGWKEQYESILDESPSLVKWIE